MSKKMIIIGLIIIAIVVGFFVLKPSEMNRGIEESMDTVTETEDMPQGTVPFQQGGTAVNVNAGTTVSVSTTRSFTVAAGSYYFTPSSMKVNKGDTVKITVTNSDGMHDLKLDEFGVATRVLKSGESQTVTFVADKSGTFDYYCSIGDHRLMGMQGKLIVE
jgi:nitrosocyanin